MILNAWPGRESNQELARSRYILEPQILLNVVMTRSNVDPTDQASAIVARIAAQPRVIRAAR